MSSLDGPKSPINETSSIVASLYESGLNFSAFNSLHDVWSRKDGVNHICHLLQNTDLNEQFPSSHHIDLSQNQLTNHELNRIVDALQYNIHCASYDSITSIDLSHNMLRHDAETTRHVVTLLFTKFPNLRRLDVTESGWMFGGDECTKLGFPDFYFDVVDSTKTRRVEWPHRKSPQIGLDDQFDFEFIDETDTEEDDDDDDDDDGEESHSHSESADDSDDEGDDDEFENLFIAEQEAEDGDSDYFDEEGDSRGFAAIQLDFYALSLCEDPSILSSCDDEESDGI